MRTGFPSTSDERTFLDNASGSVSIIYSFKQNKRKKQRLKCVHQNQQRFMRLLGVDRSDGPVCDHQTFLLFPCRYSIFSWHMLFSLPFFVTKLPKATVLVSTENHKISRYCFIMFLLDFNWDSSKMARAKKISLHFGDRMRVSDFSRHCAGIEMRPWQRQPH